MNRCLPALMATWLVLTGYSTTAQTRKKNNGPAKKVTPVAPIAVLGSGMIDSANMDLSIKPGDNFFLFANGQWLRNNPVPASETRWGSFNQLINNTSDQLHTLLDQSASSGATKGVESLVGNFYKSGMDSVTLNQKGLRVLKNELQAIDNIKDAQGVLREVSWWHTQGVDLLFGMYVGPDDKNVTENRVTLSQGGLGMPDRDYYFKTDERSKTIRDAYRNYQIKLFRMMGYGPLEAVEAGNAIYDLEKQLAEASMTRVDMRDPYKLYNKMGIATLNKRTKGINWYWVLGNLKVVSEDTLIVAQPLFFETIAKSLAKTELPVWKDYLRFHLVNALAPFLSDRYSQTQFGFYGTTLRGQKEQKPRWKRVAAVIDANMGDAVGELYVNKYFSERAKTRMLELVNNLQQSYAERIDRLTWMSAATKQKAHAKLNTFLKKIGYPNDWKDYSTLSLRSDQYLKNVLAASAHGYDHMVGRLGKPVDKAEWMMSPATVNAYYNPAFNEIVFPAAILQFPFFDPMADDAVNYGGIGAVIGHEMTHGFDDQGRQYDADGNLNDWWADADAKAFTQRADEVVKQYNGYTVLDTMHVNGQLTLGENLADLGGVTIAYDAFKKTKEGKSDIKIDGFTPDQRFFLSWAQIWRANTRPEEMAARIVTDPHSPSEHRCNGPLSNFSPWYKAFQVSQKDAMYKPESARTAVW